MSSSVLISAFISEIFLEQRIVFKTEAWQINKEEERFFY